MLNKSIEELQDLIKFNNIKINNIKINNNKNKIHALNSISTENRLGRIAILSEIAYLPICILTVLCKLVTFKYMPITILGSSLTVGLIGNMITEKSFKIKRRVARKSKAKNESEREEELDKENDLGASSSLTQTHTKQEEKLRKGE